MQVRQTGRQATSELVTARTKERPAILFGLYSNAAAERRVHMVECELLAGGLASPQDLCSDELVLPVLQSLYAAHEPEALRAAGALLQACKPSPRALSSLLAYVQVGTYPQKPPMQPKGIPTCITLIHIHYAGTQRAFSSALV